MNLTNLTPKIEDPATRGHHVYNELHKRLHKWCTRMELVYDSSTYIDIICQPKYVPVQTVSGRGIKHWDRDPRFTASLLEIKSNWLTGKGYNVNTATLIKLERFHGFQEVNIHICSGPIYGFHKLRLSSSPEQWEHIQKALKDRGVSYNGTSVFRRGNLVDASEPEIIYQLAGIDPEKLRQ
jgi:hypothetical protein